MSTFVIKLGCLAAILGIALTLIKDGGLKAYAKIGLSLVFTVSLITWLLSSLGVSNLSAGAIGSALEGRLKSVLMKAELQGSTQSDTGNAAIMEEYKNKLKEKGEEAVLQNTGLAVTLNFVVCEDITSADFGEIERIYCNIKSAENASNSPDSGENSETQNGSGKPNGIYKIEITADSIIINGKPPSNDHASSENEQAKAEAAAKIFSAISSFCGADETLCTIIWEE